MPNRQVDFLYDAGAISGLFKALSIERLSTYMRASGYNQVLALKLYVWNAELAGSLLFPLHIAEVSLRNSLHDGLTKVYGPNWPQDDKLRHVPRSSGISKTFVKDNVNRAMAKLRHETKPATTTNIVANMSFGFWTGITHADYSSQVWINTAHSIFPNLALVDDISKIDSLSNSIRLIRNRISHHEPVFGAGIDLTMVHTNIIDLIRMRDKDTANFVRKHSRVMAVLRGKPSHSKLLS